MSGVSVGHAAGSAATKRVRASPRSTRRTYGKASPAKFEPPPTQPTNTSGSASATSIWAIASWPISGSGRGPR